MPGLKTEKNNVFIKKCCDIRNNIFNELINTGFVITGHSVRNKLLQHIKQCPVKPISLFNPDVNPESYYYRLGEFLSITCIGSKSNYLELYAKKTSFVYSKCIQELTCKKINLDISHVILYYYDITIKSQFRIGKLYINMYICFNNNINDVRTELSQMYPFDCISASKVNDYIYLSLLDQQSGDINEYINNLYNDSIIVKYKLTQDMFYIISKVLEKGLVIILDNYCIQLLGTRNYITKCNKCDINNNNITNESNMYIYINNYHANCYLFHKYKVLSKYDNNEVDNELETANMLEKYINYIYVNNDQFHPLRYKKNN